MSHRNCSPEHASLEAASPTSEDSQTTTSTGYELTNCTNCDPFSIPPRLDMAKLYGPAGDIVRAIFPHTESDAAAIYAQLLTGLGNLIGPSPYFVADGAQHRPNLYTVIVGRTAKARKGTSWQQARQVLEEVDEDWERKRVKSGTVSGEGIAQVFEPEGDRRLLLLEGEFAQVLQVLKREGNTVSVLLRQAWDGQRIATLRRNNPIEVEGAHLSMIGHITVPELHKLLATVEMSNGLANRCLWLHADRSKLLPEGGGQAEYSAPLKRLRDAVRAARARNELRRAPEASVLWGRIYTALSVPPTGSMGDILSRGEAQVMRLALLFALLDESTSIGCEHLQAALALWRYAEASTQHIFAEVCASPKALRLWEALGRGPMTLSEIHAFFNRNVSRSELQTLLQELAPRIEILHGDDTQRGERIVRRR